MDKLKADELRRQQSELVKGGAQTLCMVAREGGFEPLLTAAILVSPTCTEIGVVGDLRVFSPEAVMALLQTLRSALQSELDRISTLQRVPQSKSDA